jgi:hypothetical protein
MRRKGLHRGSVLVTLVLVGCGGMKDAASVADKFVDRYYVESDQDRALPLSTGVASMRLREELKLTRESRQGNAGMQLRPVRVYYRRTALTGDGGGREVDYELDIRPQGGGEMQRSAHLSLARQEDGTWRVSRFSESQPR